jgi:hypothetical protein
MSWERVIVNVVFGLFYLFAGYCLGYREGIKSNRAPKGE